MDDDKIRGWIVRLLRARDEEVSISHHPFGKIEAEVLVEELGKKENSNVQTLKLIRCVISKEGAAGLATLLVGEEFSLKRLFLIACEAKEEADVQVIGATLMRALEGSKMLQDLDIMGSRLFGKRGDILCGLLEKNKSLKRLDLRNMALRKEAPHVLDCVLAEKRIARLTIGENEVGEEDGKRMIASLSSRNACLRSLSVCWTQFGETGAKLWADLLKTDQILEELELFHCGFGDVGGTMICSALLHNTTLKRLNFGANNCKSAAGNALAKLLESNATLKIVETAQNSFSGPVWEGICTALAKNQTLHTLDASFLGLEEEDFVCFAEKILVGGNSALRIVKLCTFNVEDEGGEILARALRGNTKIEELVWPQQTMASQRKVSEILLEGNGALLECNGKNVEVCERNLKNAEKAREAVQTLRVMGLGKIPKDVVKIIARHVWASRRDFEAWKEK